MSAHQASKPLDAQGQGRSLQPQPVACCAHTLAAHHGHSLPARLEPLRSAAGCVQAGGPPQVLCPGLHCPCLVAYTASACSAGGFTSLRFAVHISCSPGYRTEGAVVMWFVAAGGSCSAALTGGAAWRAITPAGQAGRRSSPPPAWQQGQGRALQLRAAA